MTDNIRVQDVSWNLNFKVHLGETWGRFMEGLIEKRIWATSCDTCARTFVPPQPFCETCFEPASSWKEVPGRGTLQTWTISEHAFEGSPPAPYGIAAVKLEGADTMLIHFLGGVDYSDLSRAQATLQVGDEVEVVWSDDRKGHIHDIKHFVPVRT